MNNKKILTLSAVLLLSIFCIFVILYERYVHLDAQHQIVSHATIISEALWQDDPKSTKAYVFLATRFCNYRELVVRDTRGNIFQRAEGKPPGPLDQGLIYLKLIHIKNLSSEVVHNNLVIGTVEAQWYCHGVYVELIVFLALMMIQGIFYLYLRLFWSHLELEDRVELRTETLTELNEFLQREIQDHKQAKKELKESQAQLVQARKMESLGTLAGGIAHDFNNMLSPIVGHSEMLLLDIPPDSPFRKSLEIIQNSALKARDMVKQILTFARQDKGTVSLISMQPIVKESLKLIRSIIPASIEIRQEIQNNCSPIMADATQIHQVLMNLMINAYLAMDNTVGVLTISLSEREIENTTHLVTPETSCGRYICLKVQDTGAGMEPEIMKKIFDPFFTTRGKGKGTGMGLSVVHGIVRTMKGGIQVKSTLGAGSQFFIYFPVETKKSLPGNPLDHHPAPHGNETILLVDDDTSIMEMSQEMLERLGYKVISFSNSLEAIKSFQDAPNKFDLIITDLAMPGLAGDQLITRIVSLRPGIPVILCTGFGDAISEKKAKALGITALVLKPMEMKHMARTIRRVLETK